ncbi:hypothetical protein AOLI_G00002670 [Acnodon oligacanthus]
MKECELVPHELFMFVRVRRVFGLRQRQPGLSYRGQASSEEVQPAQVQAFLHLEIHSVKMPFARLTPGDVPPSACSSSGWALMAGLSAQCSLVEQILAGGCLGRTGGRCPLMKEKNLANGTAASREPRVFRLANGYCWESSRR